MQCIVVLLTLAAAHASEPVLLAPVAPADRADAAMAQVIGDQTRARLVGDGLLVLDAASVTLLVSADQMRACPLDPVPCAREVIDGLPIKLATLARLDRIGSTLLAHVELIAPSASSPAATLDVPIAPGSEHLFSVEVSQLLQRTLASMEPADEAMRASAAMLLARSTAPRPAAPPPAAPPRGSPGGGAAPRATPAAPAGSRAESIDAQLEGTGIRPRRLAGSKHHFERSGLDARDWVWRAAPHAGRLIIEARAGFGLGDVDRQALLRVETTDGVQTNGWYREGPARSSNFRGSGYLGFAPITALDVGVLFGFQYANRSYQTGLVDVGSDGALLSISEGTGAVVEAIDLYLQPRLRVYIAPVGPAKPYLVGGGDFKVFNAYQLDQRGAFTFPVPSGAWIPGVLGGAGLMIDPGPDVGLFAEGTYTRHLGPRAASTEFTAEGDWRWAGRENRPTDSMGATVEIAGGVQFRL